jgi:hypothetical protein
VAVFETSMDWSAPFWLHQSRFCVIPKMFGLWFVCGSARSGRHRRAVLVDLLPKHGPFPQGAATAFDSGPRAGNPTMIDGEWIEQKQQKQYRAFQEFGERLGLFQ